MGGDVQVILIRAFSSDFLVATRGVEGRRGFLVLGGSKSSFRTKQTSARSRPYQINRPFYSRMLMAALFDGCL